MDPHHDLRAMIEAASRWTDEQFAAKGKILPVWHVIADSGRCLILPSPPGDKDTSATIMRSLLHVLGATRYMFIAEAWAVELKADELDEVERLDRDGASTHPRRLEVVMFSGEDQSGELLGRRRIERPRNGKPYLGPLELEAMSVSEGRLVGMLPQRGARN
jgi:hypothetical protein